MAAPPRQHGRGRHPPQQADRGLAIAREDPVLVLESVERARLDRLVAPEDRGCADPALAVVDDGALLVGAQQHHGAVELEQLLLADAVRGPVRTGLAVADPAPQDALGGDGAGPRARTLSQRHTTTVTASPSASSTTETTSPRSSPSACSGVGASHRIS